MLDVEKLLRLRGILDPKGAIRFDSKKEEMEYLLSVGSNYLQNGLNQQELQEMNDYLEESEKVRELNLQAKTVNYKECILESYRMIADPFKVELDDINFDQNPNDPSQLQMNIKFKNARYQQINDQQ